MINDHWLSAAEREIQEADRLRPDCARAVTLRLSTLLLQRLGPPLSSELSDLIPSADRPLIQTQESDRSIGLPDFILHAGFVLGLYQPDLISQEHEETLRRIVVAFFTGVLGSLPESIGYRVDAALPSEIRNAAVAIESVALESRTIKVA
ncbi:MAG: hypothetical protein RJB38_2217 [Pseudomonadota bacterium]|jgi:hypothetical protein